MNQHTEQLLMIQPVRFDFNAETSVNNSFQLHSGDQAIQEKAAKEFAHFIEVLTRHHISVTVIADTPEPHTPDSIFPNNWISFHENGTICLYPMFALNRRLERNTSVLDTIRKKFEVTKLVDLSHYEQENRFLEGTGSMVLDRQNQVAYACLSPRTHTQVLNAWCTEFGYRPVPFTAVDNQGLPIYHTNVMLCVADRFAVVCLESLHNPEERKLLLSSFAATGKEVIEISYDQMNHFAGNMLQVHNQHGQAYLVMSSQAFHSLADAQLTKITSYQPILHADIKTIETNGGGSARCMIAEVFLPVRKDYGFIPK